MKIVMTIIMVALMPLCAINLTSCKSTGDIGADAMGYWNSPAAQALLQKIQDEAFAWITGQIHLAGASASGSVASVKDRAVAAEQKKHPDVPASVIRDQVDKAYARLQ